MLRARRPALSWLPGLGLRILAAALAARAFAPAPAAAQGLQVAPVNLELAAGETITTVTVSNHSDQPTGIQVRSFDWRQEGGQDVLSPTQLLEVSPPIFEVPPGGSQLVRLVLRSTPDTREASYRLLFDQLPTANGRGVTLALRFSVPLFAEPQGAVSADLAMHLERQGAGGVLVARNDGGRHDRLLAPALTVGGARIGLESNTNYYVLAGSERRWPLAGRQVALRPGSSVMLTANSLAGRVNTPVPVLGP